MALIETTHPEGMKVTNLKGFTVDGMQPRRHWSVLHNMGSVIVEDNRNKFYKKCLTKMTNTVRDIHANKCR